MLACLDMESRRKRLAGTRRLASIRACKATPAGGAVGINSAFTWPTALFCLPYRKTTSQLASGRHHMDAFVRRYIHDNLSYRFVLMPDGSATYAIEKTIKQGEWEHGCPLLNPRVWQ